MKPEFYKNDALYPETIQITTHPTKEKEWAVIEKAILFCDEKLILIDAKHDQKIPVRYDDILSIVSEERMCNVKRSDGAMLLLDTRLKTFEKNNTRKHFIKINSSTIINTKYIACFQSAANARIEVLMKDSSTHYVNRYCMKNFKENLS